MLQPGFGYWVKVSQDGAMILTTPGQPCPGTPTVEYAGKTYTTVLIGSQCWLRENLDVGTRINGSQNQTNNSTIEKYCYDNNPANCTTYGALYQWNEAMRYDTTEGIQGICPPGWHLPTIVEVETLRATVYGDGNALKAIGQGTGSGAGTNTSGFSALLGGRRYFFDGAFLSLAEAGNFWSSTHGHSLMVDALSATIYHLVSSKTNGFSVRCLKNEAPNQPPDPPSNPYPDNGATNITTSPTLSWSCGDPDGDPLTYDVYFGSVNPPDALVSSDQSDTTVTRTGLAPGMRYYWKVIARTITRI